ncbi:MAG: MMPL family transporter, partial [Myxococcota bacterium]
ATGTPINVIISTLPTILIATSGTYLVYALGLLAKLQHVERPGIALVHLLWKPVLLSSASTAIGFGSLRVIGMESAGDLGMALSAGIVAAAAGTLLLVPALIHRFDITLAPRETTWLQTLPQIGVRAARRPWAVLAATALVLAMALPGLARLELHTDTLQYFAPDNPVRTGADFFQDELSSGFLLNVVIRSEEEGRAIAADTLAFAKTLRTQIEAIPQVDRTISMLDYFQLMDAAMRPDAVPDANPGSRARASQYLLLYESSGDPDDYERYLTFDRSALSLIVSIHGGSTVYLDAAEAIAATAAAVAPEGVRVDTLGTTFLYSKAMEDLTRGMLQGLAVAAGLIMVVLVVGLGSLKLGLLATIPNLLPIVLCGGLFGWLGVPISMSTSLMGCIALGLAVDDTSHVVGHVSPHESLEKLYGLVGGPIVLTTLALCSGYAVLLASEFATVEVLGASVIATLLLALVADLLVLPSLLVLAGVARTESERLDRIAPPPKTRSSQPLHAAPSERSTEAATAPPGSLRAQSVGGRP